jgi:hypothetical protein
VSNTILAYPGNDWQTIVVQAMELEKKAFLQSPDKVGKHGLATEQP